MKKILSLLSVLTISGTAVPTTIAISSYEYEKQEHNNTDILIRNKRRGERINIYSKIPGYLYFQGSLGGPSSGNAPDWQEVKNLILSNSVLPSDVINNLNYNYLSQRGVSVYISNEYKFNGNTYYGLRTINFYYN